MYFNWQTDKQIMVLLCNGRVLTNKKERTSTDTHNNLGDYIKRKK